jgi:hypothetical protein
MDKSYNFNGNDKSPFYRDQDSSSDLISHLNEPYIFDWNQHSPHVKYSSYQKPDSNSDSRTFADSETYVLLSIQSNFQYETTEQDDGSHFLYYKCRSPFYPRDPSSQTILLNQPNNFDSTQCVSLGNYSNNQQPDSTSVITTSLRDDNGLYFTPFMHSSNFQCGKTEQNDRSYFDYDSEPSYSSTIQPLYENITGSHNEI